MLRRISCAILQALRLSVIERPEISRIVSRNRVRNSARKIWRLSVSVEENTSGMSGFLFVFSYRDISIVRLSGLLYSASAPDK